eukprot:CAMPEP_0197526960 /NCGR_PEP_ID=MMETSP1318-20131121/19883_1 /TAXON_ID=552666 /ORGANISM="Partenskyella glossopodia, Strain RCC365" /LENGTH=308 /DNA_ID=CAMNT_0043081371 /DNA_START=102 /DNA_END=1028 /DNA_ORIENTATION=+
MTSYRSFRQIKKTSSLRGLMFVGVGSAFCLASLAPAFRAAGSVGNAKISTLLPKAQAFMGRAARFAMRRGPGIAVGTSVSAFTGPMRAAAFGWTRPIKKLEEEQCVKGSPSPIPEAPSQDSKHFLLGTPMYGPFPDNMEMVSLGMGCFWCSENLFMRMPGVYSTHVGYAQGVTENPSYEQVCSGRTNHNEVVRIVYDPSKIRFEDILKIFWERHDPTTPNQQGNDRGTQYRSGIYYYTEAQKNTANKMLESYQKVLYDKGFGKITTEIEEAQPFFYAEDYHQQYDAKPGSRQYCGLSPLGTSFPLEAI